MLTDPATYRTRPGRGLDADQDPLDGAALPRGAEASSRASARRIAQSRNVPRARILKDDALVELAANRPHNHEDLGKSRLLLREARRGDIADGILAAIAARRRDAGRGRPARRRAAAQRKPGSEALADLLRVLLKARAETEGVAPAADRLERRARRARRRRAGVPPLHGWRHEVFGRDAQRLIRGEIALSAQGGAVRVIPIETDDDPNLPDA